jgi:hypothetical protein
MRSPAAFLRMLAATALASCFAIVWCPAAASAAKTDVVVLRNGDRITGEIKSLAYGKLEYSTDDAGRLSIEWDKVARITSPHSFQLETVAGFRYFGRLGVANRDGFVVVIADGVDTLATQTVVEISQFNATFVQRLKAYLDVGFTLAKAHQATTFSLSGATEYRGENIGSQLKFDSYAQGQESVPTTTRNSGRGTVSWFLSPHWSAVGIAQIEQNDELDLDHRVTGGGAMQRTLQHTNRMELAAAGGAVITREQFAHEAATPAATNFEGLLALNWSAFRFDSPKLDFGFSVGVFPSFSDWGRVRGQTDLRLKYELFSDFDAGILVNETFDSRPPDPTASTNDYIVTLTIGWSYRR